MGIGKCICRIGKIKSVGALGGAYQHNVRERETLNADTSKTIYNREFISSATKSYVELFHDKIENSSYYKNHNIRKNAVYAIEFFVGFSPTAKGKIDLDKWCEHNIEWIAKYFGGMDNILSAILHVDESTPHMHIVVIPFDKNNKLNYTQYLGGSKYQLSEMQDTYYNEVGKRHNLDRGIKGSKAKHQDVDEFYNIVNNTKVMEEVPLLRMNVEDGKVDFVDVCKHHNKMEVVIYEKTQEVNTIRAENTLLKQRIDSIEHLANHDGVKVVEDMLLEIQEKNNIVADQSNKIETLQYQSNYFYDLFRKQKQENNKIKSSIPELIKEAVEKAVIELKETVQYWVEQYGKIRKAFQFIQEENIQLNDQNREMKEKLQNQNNKAIEQELEVAKVIIENYGVDKPYKACLNELRQGRHGLWTNEWLKNEKLHVKEDKQFAYHEIKDKYR